MLSTYFPKRNIQKLSEGVAIRLMRICDTDSKFELRSKEYGQSLIARSYKPCKVCKQFSEVTKVPRETVKQLLNIHKMIYKFEKYRTLMDSLKAEGVF